MINNKGEEIKKVQSERISVFVPNDERNYAHHAFITHFKGEFYVIWSCGFFNEDDCGQCVMLSKGSDIHNLTKPEILIAPETFGDPKCVLTAAGFHINGDELVIYYGYYKYDPEQMVDGRRPQTDIGHIETDMGYITTTDGKTFSKPVSLGIHLVPNHAPKATSSGRLIISGGIMFPYSDDPSGKGPYSLTGIYGDAFGNERPYDDSVGIQIATKNNGWNAPLICEGCFFETDDKALHMMLRSNMAFLWCSDSTDNGETWTQPYQTEFSTDGSKFTFMRLKDGKFAYIGNPKWHGNRGVLRFSTSENGVDFDKHYVVRDEPYDRKYPGFFKGGVYGYPHMMELDGKIYTVYSLNKEAVEISVFDLSEIK